MGNLNYRWYKQDFYDKYSLKTDAELDEAYAFQSTNWGSQRGCLCESALIALEVIDQIREERKVCGK